jgi:hypothetical protein
MKSDIDLSKMDKTFVRKGKIKNQGNDFLFWQSQTYEKRLETIEIIRQEYNTWKYGNEQGFQRVYKIIKRKSSNITE